MEPTGGAPARSGDEGSAGGAGSSAARSERPAPDRQMSVAIVAEQLRRRVPGGIGTYVTCLVRGLAGLPRPPRLSLIAGRDRVGPSLGEKIGAGLQIAASGPQLPTEVVTRLWDHGLLSAGATGRRADVVHATSMAAPPLRGPLTKRSGVGGSLRGREPLFTAMVHDLAWRRSPESFPARGRRWHEAALQRMAARASAVVVPSAQVADDLTLSAAGWDRSQIVVIPEGADRLPPPDEVAASQALRRLGVAGDFLLTVSTLEPRKNLARARRRLLLSSDVHARAVASGRGGAGRLGPSPRARRRGGAGRARRRAGAERGSTHRLGWSLMSR